MENPIGTLAAALAHAEYQAFEEMRYLDRDWTKYRTWKSKHFDNFTAAEKRELYEQERKTGVPMGPADSIVERSRRPKISDIEVIAMFPQTWSSTALGFGGIGGQAMTPAYTVILRCGIEHAVYFAGRHAYTVKQPNDKFFQDLQRNYMSDVRGHTQYF